MANDSRARRTALIIIEIAFVALLGLIVVTSDATSWQGKTAQAGDNAAQGKKANKAQKHGKDAKEQDRSVPPEGIAEEESRSLLAQAGTPFACQTFDFAGGDPQGFTVVAAPGTPLGTPLWHITNNLCRANLPGHSVPFDFYYGQDMTCNYNTGARNASSLVSPSFDLSTRFPPFSLGFNYLLFVEGGGFDTAFVDISTDGGTTWTQVLSKANLINDNQWHNRALDISAFVGSATSVRLRFRFDSIDNIANSTTGWHVDDVEVCGTPFYTCVQDDSTRSVLQFNSITGAYLFSDCQGFTLSGTGTLTVRGSTTTLRDTRSDRRVSVSIDRSVMKATASIQLFSPSRLFTIIDRNIGDNTCSCPF